MMIAQGPQAGLPSPVAPAAAPNSDTPAPASAQGFLAVLGAAIQQAIAPKPAPVAASGDTSVEPSVPQVEIPGPGDTEQADGWKGPSTTEEALSQARQLSQPVVTAPTTWNDLVSGKATRPIVAPSATRPAQAIATGAAPKASAPNTPRPSPIVTVKKTAAVPQADGSDDASMPELPAPTAASAKADVKPAQATNRVTPLKKEMKPVESAAPSAVRPQESKDDAAPIAIGPAVPVAAAPVVPAAQPNVELARVAAQCLATTAQPPVPTSGKAAVAPRSGSPVRGMPVAAVVPQSIDSRSVPAEPVRRSAPTAGAARQPIATQTSGSADHAATDIRTEPVKQPLPPEVTVRVTESTGNTKADLRPTPEPAPVAVTVPVTNPMRPTSAESADDSDSGTSRAPQQAIRAAKTREPGSPLSEPALPTPVPHSTLAGAQAHRAEPIAAPAPEAPVLPTARVQAEPAPQPRGTERVTLQLPHDDGGMTRVRIAVRGDQVRTTLISSDASTSAQLISQAPELERALAARGFRDAEVAVPQPVGTAPLRETGSGAALGIASADSASGERLQGNNRHADGSAGESRQGTAERDRESPDQRAEDQPRQGRSHQRARRERAR